MYIYNVMYYIIINILDQEHMATHPTDFSKCNHNLPIISFLKDYSQNHKFKTYKRILLIIYTIFHKYLRELLNRNAFPLKHNLAFIKYKPIGSILNPNIIALTDS